MRIAICDDDEPVLHHIRQLLQEAYADNNLPWQEPACFTDALALLDSGEYDVVYLDIEMPLTSGLEAAAAIRARNKQTQLIFVTSHSDYVFETFQVMPTDFLTKPIDSNRFAATFRRMLDNYRFWHQRIACAQAGGTIVLNIADICYVGSEGKRTRLYLQDGTEHILIERIGELATRLAPYGIIRCHRTYLVNLAYVQAIASRRAFRPGRRSEGKEVRLAGVAISLPIGEKYLADFKQALLHYQG